MAYFRSAGGGTGGGSAFASQAANAALRQQQEEEGPSFGNLDLGWNMLSNFSQVTGAAANWFDQKTSIGDFNPGLGHMVHMAANMVPGLINQSYQIGKAGVSGKPGEAADLVGETVGGMWRSITDTSTDIVTLGGFMPYSEGVQDLQKQVYGHRPKTLREYAMEPGQGVAGTLFADAANIAMVADGAGALARIGTIGKVASGARLAETAGKVRAIDLGSVADDVAKAGMESRTAKIAEHLEQVEAAGGNPAAAAAKIDKRIQTMERIDAVRNGAYTLIAPWRAARPLARAAGEQYRRMGETPISPETPLEAPVRPAEPAPVPGAAAAPETPPGQAGAEAGALFGEAFGTTQVKPKLDLKAQIAEAAAAIDRQAGEAKPFVEEPPAPGFTRLYNGGSGAQEMWTTNKSRAESYRTDASGADAGLRHIDVPDAEAMRLETRPGTEAYRQAVEASGGNQPATKGDYFLGGHARQGIVEHGPAAAGPRTGEAIWRNADTDQPVTVTGSAGKGPDGREYVNIEGSKTAIPADEIVWPEGTTKTTQQEGLNVPTPEGEVPPQYGPPEPAGTTPSVSANTANGKSHGVARQLENVPRAYQSYIEQSKPVPRWAENVVARMPEPIRQTLAWMDAHHQRVDWIAMTRQQMRSLAIDARRIENTQPIKDLKAAATAIVQERMPGVTPTVASNIVGQMIRVFITHPRELIEQLESARPAMDAIDPTLIDQQLLYSYHIPDEINTPEFRQQMWDLMEPYKEMRLEASARMKESVYLRDKGLTAVDDDMPLLTKNEKSHLRRAQHKMNRAAKLEEETVPRQLEGLSRELAREQDAVMKASEAADTAMATMAEARTDFDRSRHVPKSVDTPQKLATMTNDLAERTVRDSGGTFNPTTGEFITMAGEQQGYIVDVMPVTEVPLSEWMTQNPETGRLQGAHILDNFVHGYQEAFQFPDITVGTWVDGNGNVHIDVSQYLSGQSNRDHAMTLAAAREMTSIKEVHTGTDINVPLNPNNSAYFLKKHVARDTRARQLRDIRDRQIEAGGRGLEETDIDNFMAFADHMAVQQHLLHPDQYASADSFYSKGWDVRYAERTVEGALNEVRPKVRSKAEIVKILRPIMQDATAESRWYFDNHDYIEKIAAQLPDVELGLNTPWSNARKVSGRELLYSLVAIHSINASPSENMASAIAGFLNFTKTDIRKLAGQIKTWAETPQELRTPRSGGLDTLPPFMQELLKNTNQVSRRQTLAVLDGWTLDLWDDAFVRETMPNYGNKEGAKLPVESVTKAELDAHGGDLQAALMEHFGSSAQAKLRSFHDNLMNPHTSMSVTLDAHMARAFGEQDTFWNGPNWFKHAQMIRAAAADLSAELGRDIKPHEVQAALWYWVKNQYHTVQVAGQRANVLDNLRLIDNGTYSAATDVQRQFHQRLIQEAGEFRPEGQLTEKRKMKFVDEPLTEGSKAKTRTVEWRRTAAKRSGGLSKDGESVMKQAALYDEVVAKTEAKLAEGDIAGAKQVQLDYMAKTEKGLERKTQGENFWDMERKSIVKPLADELDINLPGALNEMREDLLGQFVRSNKVTGGVIRLFKDADFATLMHEGGHLLRALTPEQDLIALERAYGVTRGNWTVAAEEAFVHDFLATAAGDMTGPMAAPMARLKQVLADAYGEYGGTLHPEVDSFWQKVLAPTPRIEPEGFELSTGEKLVGVQGRSELGKTMLQRQRQLPNPPGSSMEMYRRGATGEAAIDSWKRAARKKRESEQAAARAAKNVEQIETMIAERMVPAQATANLLRQQAQRTFANIGDRLDDPAMNRVPAKWQPMVTTAKKMAEDIEKYPQLEPILESFPKTFGQALDYAAVYGFDPAYMPDLTPAAVRKLVAGTAQLGNQGTREMGKQYTSGARRQRRGTLQQLGTFDNSIDALVAGLNQVAQEERTNMVVDWVDRVVAYDLPVNAAGQRLGPPPGWEAWDPIKRSMLTMETATGEVIPTGATKMIPTVVARTMREYMGPAPTNPFYRTMSKITDPWRALMLTLNPGFYTKNVIGAILQAGFAGGVDPRNWLKAYKQVRTGTMPAEVTGLDITMAELGRPGLVEWPSLKDAYITGGKAEAGKYIAQQMHKVVSVSDMFARAVAYESKRRKGYSEMESAQYAIDAVIDYGNLSNTERYWARTIIPLYSFQKGMTKLLYRLPVDHPIWAAGLMALSDWQTMQAVDDEGNPLPEYMQGLVDLPFLGKVDLQKYSPYTAAETFTSAEGLLNSMQFGLQAVARTALGQPSWNTTAGVKVDKFGRLVPDVELHEQLLSSVLGGPQGRVIETGDIKRFLGVPTVPQEKLQKAIERNVISQAEFANTTEAEQQRAAAFPVDGLSMQFALQKRIKEGTMETPEGYNPSQIQEILQTRIAEQQARSQATKAANKGGSFGKGKSGGRGKIRKPRTQRLRFGKTSRRTRYRLRQGFGRSSR